MYLKLYSKNLLVRERERERKALPGSKNPRGAINVVNHPLHRKNEKYTKIRRQQNKKEENIRRQHNNVSKITSAK